MYGVLSATNQLSNGTFTVYPTTGTNYEVRCTNTSGQTGSGNVYVGVTSSGTGVTVYLNSNYTNIQSGQAVNLNWSASPVYGSGNYCTLMGNGLTLATNQNFSGSYTVNPTTNTNYQINCTNGNGQTGTASVYVTVGGSTSNTTVTVSPTNTTITSGQSTNLVFNVTNATYCYLNGGVYSSSYYAGNSLATITVNPTQTTTYTANCYGANNASSAVTATVNVSNVNSPTLTVTPETQSVSLGQTAYIAITTTNVTSCKISGGSLNNINFPINTTKAVTPTYNTIYLITCTGSGGSIVKTATVNVDNTPVLSVNPETSTVGAGQSVTLAITSSNIDSCTIRGGEIVNAVNVTKNGTKVVNPTTTSTYTVTCIGPGGTVTKNATVNVNNTPSLTVSANPASINAGQTSTLNVSSANISSCRVTGGIYNNSAAPTNGSLTVSPTSNTTYNFTCNNINGSTSTGSVTVSVTTTAPVLSLNPETKTVLYGEPVTIALTKQNISYCTIQGGAYPTATNIGSADSIIVTPTVTTSYTFVCTGTNGGTTQKSSIITVNSTPTISATTTQPTIVSGNSATISITRQNTNSCTVSGGGYTNALLSNSTSTFVVSPTTTTTYSFSCTGVNGGTGTASLLINVITAPAISVTPYNPTITRGQVVNFSLNKTNVSTCTINGSDIGQANIWSYVPQTTTTYTFICTNPTLGTSVSTSSIVTVNN